MEIDSQEIINLQKLVISDLQHQNLIMQIQIQKLQAERNNGKKKDGDK